ncbi:ETX/MTX2 family pore-forming toxin [Virgibacillus chiguensis]|uniref:Toxin ETX/toxin MTX2 n=1 Tax=Virgibacillus chiguensis TaxID=411959 RepID=A0A1M5Q9X5_9BACI|nr:ETX/MTX2 family pore-forming toxin [Virgibacillus chiguensis]SHH10768.1 toxin ETX/toxin MTX2 [Virgibacillus chiguensis]
MAILDLREAITEASKVYAEGNNLTFSKIRDLEYTDSRLEIPNDVLIVDNPGRSIVARKEIINRTNKPTEPQTISFERKTEDTVTTKTTEGFEFGVSTEVSTNVNVFFANFDISVSTSFKYNTSTETTYESKETISWSENIPVVVPPKTKTIVNFIITIGDFNALVSFLASVYGIVRFNYNSGPYVATDVPLTYRGLTGESIGDIMGRLYNFNTQINPTDVYLLDIEGSLNLQGALGVQSSTEIINQPLAGNPLPESVQTIPGTTRNQAVFF